jgi:hypothetical protein
MRLSEEICALLQKTFRAVINTDCKVWVGVFVINNVGDKDYHSCGHFELALHPDCAFLYQFLTPFWGNF